MVSKKFAKLLAAVSIFCLLSISCSRDSYSPSPSSPPPSPKITNPQNLNGLGPAAVDLGSAGNYVILSKAGISDTSGSAIVGDIAISPAAASYITNLSLLTLDPSGMFSTSASVTGKVYAADYVGTAGYEGITPSNLTVAVGDMETAYNDAAGRTIPDFVELSSGEIGGLTLSPGLYKWGTDVGISTDVTIDGGVNDVLIFQISGNLTMAAAKNIILSGGILASNIFWQVAGQVDVGTTSHFEGIILSKTSVNFLTNSSLKGSIYAQTAVTLDSSDITK